MVKTLIVALLVCAVAPLCGAQTLWLARVDTAHAPRLAAQLEREGFDIFEGRVSDSTFEIAATDEQLWRLRALGLNPVVLSRGRPFKDIQAERLAAERARPGLDGVPTGYRDLEQIIADMHAVAAAYPEIARVVDLTERYGPSATANGRHMYAVKISDNVEADEDEPSALLVSCHHAREIVTPVIAMNAINQLVQKYATDPTIRTLVDRYEIWIAPVWNPDGYSYVFTTDNYWRKNRRPFAASFGYGVDQNRNYPIGWDIGCGQVSSDIFSEVYRGPSAASEPETRTMMTFSADRHFAKALDYHSSGGEVLYGYRCLIHPMQPWLVKEAAALAGASGYGGRVRIPSAEGEHQEWQMAARSCLANLIETQVEFQPPFAAAKDEADRVWPGIVHFLNRPITVSGHVTDAATGAPVSATITLEGVKFQNGEANYSEPRFGRYHVFLPEGQWTVRFQAEGYPDVAVPIFVMGATQLVREVRMGGPPLPPACEADCDGNSRLDIDDFTCFQGKFANQDPNANCNGDALHDGTPKFDALDFACFQNRFALGCP